LLYKVDYEVDAPNDTVLLARQPLEIRKDYYNDQQAILARDNEEATLRTEMLRQAVRALLNQARFTYKKSNAIKARDINRIL
jgi:LPS-assembly lipoprotein